jgi:hypothetical protein
VALTTTEASAVVCAAGVYRAGCVSAGGAAVVARPVVVTPRPVVVAPRRRFTDYPVITARNKAGRTIPLSDIGPVVT